MSLNNALNNGQPNSGSFKFVSRVESLKDFKQLSGMLHIKSDTIVFDIIDMVIFSCDAADFNNSCLLRFREFDGVG